VSDHPVCAASEASRLFLIGAATPPHEEGNSRLLRPTANSPSMTAPTVVILIRLFSD